MLSSSPSSARSIAPMPSRPVLSRPPAASDPAGDTVSDRNPCSRTCSSSPGYWYPSAMCIPMPHAPSCPGNGGGRYSSSLAVLSSTRCALLVPRPLPLPFPMAAPVC
eukprot:3932694-Rhodomonas_salina.1